MLNSSDVAEILTSSGLVLSGPVVRQDGDRLAFYAFIEVSKDSNGHQKPSNIYLGKISEELVRSGVLVKFILNDTANFDLEAGLRATLLHAFPEWVRNSFLTIDSQGCTVWIVPKGGVTRSYLEEIKNRAAIYINNASLSLLEVKLTVNENLPSRTAILMELRIAAPINVEVLISRLESKGFSSPPIDYVNRHLDALRRAGQIIRRKDGLYCLTAGALKVLGTVKRRNSPDVVRFLDLARRNEL
ncbi:hypothetical protein [Salipiger marinus]|uniref:Uncharacterized protein n=1 Tax=Salipiger marinus TaxID=555512 RepID=A0A1G8LLX6_9RHOB|nr:hypothetical protein [Salipiger marinus]SDI56702.1 hypothetical protein SAMN04487993_1006248 [Salipiger marinus]